MKITITNYDKTVSWETSYEDNNTDEIMEAIKHLLMGLTYQESSIISSMEELVDEFKFPCS